VTVETTLTFAERVNAGALWLDQHHPGWVDRINLDILDLYDCQKCVLGQMFGLYSAAPLAPADYPTEWLDDVAIPLGFDIDDESYTQLTDAWRDLILAHRASGAA
jgi:hypothetical protein